MEEEKLLPKGEEGIEVTALPVLRTPPVSGMPSPKAQQWGVLISIIIIVLMIIIGAFYAWGERIAQNQVFTTPTETTQ